MGKHFLAITQLGFRNYVLADIHRGLLSILWGPRIIHVEAYVLVDNLDLALPCTDKVDILIPRSLRIASEIFSPNDVLTMKSRISNIGNLPCILFLLVNRRHM